MIPVNDDFQAVIFAGGKGSRMSQLLGGKPKCLLPIANKPMIAYPLEMLIRSEIKNTFILVLDNEEEVIRTAVNKLGLDIAVTYVAISHNADCATAESLRTLRDKIEKNILIISCDTITDLKLDAFIRLFRLEMPTVCCLLSSFGSEKENQVPAKKLHDNKEFDIIGLDAEVPNRVVFFEPDSEFTDSVPLKKSHFIRHCPHFTLSSKLQDAHIYLLDRSLLKYLCARENIKSVKSDLVPSIVRKQFRKVPTKGSDVTKVGQDDDDSNDELQSSPNKKGNKEGKHEGAKHLVDYIEKAPIYELIDQLDSGDLDAELPPQPYPNGTIKCCALTIGPKDLESTSPESNASYCIRANNWVRFCEANRVVLLKQRGINKPAPKSEHVRSYVDGSSLLGPGSSVGEKTTLKRTVVGTNCTLGSKVKLTNCILLDGVTVEDGAVITNSLLCSGSSVGVNAEIRDCILGHGQSVHGLAKHTNESLTEEMLDL